MRNELDLKLPFEVECVGCGYKEKTIVQDIIRNYLFLVADPEKIGKIEVFPYNMDVYDRTGRLWLKCNFHEWRSWTPAVCKVTEYRYDRWGRVREERTYHIYKDGRVSKYPEWKKYTYGRFNKPIFIEKNNGWERFEYDDNGHLIFWEDDDGNWERYEYDNQGRLIFEEDSFGKWIEYIYENGELVEKRYRDGTAFDVRRGFRYRYRR